MSLFFYFCGGTTHAHACRQKEKHAHKRRIREILRKRQAEERRAARQAMPSTLRNTTGGRRREDPKNMLKFPINKKTFSLLMLVLRCTPDRGNGSKLKSLEAADTAQLFLVSVYTFACVVVGSPCWFTHPPLTTRKYR